MSIAHNKVSITVQALCAVCFLTCTLSCSDLYLTKRRAGDNWPELEKVLHRYQNDPDIQKLQAAEFIVQNIPYHYYIYNEDLERAKTGFRQVRELPASDADAMIDSLTANLSQNASSDIMWDARTLDSAYICDNIDWAFKVWKEQPWGKNVDFEMFCNYILPYRIADEVPESWRAEYYEKYNHLLDEFRSSGLYDAEDPVEALRFLLGRLPILYNPKYAPRLVSHFSHIGATYVQYCTGSCREYSDFVIYICRALGIPCALNESFNMHRENAGHHWANFWNKYGEEYIISNYPPVLVPNRSDYTLATPKLKVYRKAYEVNNRLFDKAKKARSPLNISFSLPTYTDVTATYTDLYQKELVVRPEMLYSDVPYREPVYLCSSAGMKWRPEDYAIASNGTYEFNDIQTGEICCLCIASANNMVPVSEPFLIDPATHNIVWYHKSDGETMTVTMSSKFSVTPEETMFRDRMRNGVIEGADSWLFDSPDTLYIVQNPPGRKFTHTKAYSSAQNKYGFLRYKGAAGSYCDVAEISYYDKYGVKFHPVAANGTDGDDSTHHYYNVYDGDSRTSFSGKAPDGGWCGIELLEASDIHSVEYTPRNRDNFINAGDTYELFYYDRRWKSLGIKVADSDILTYEAVPDGCLLILKNHSGGVQERIFTFENGKQVWR